MTTTPKAAARVNIDTGPINAQQPMSSAPVRNGLEAAETGINRAIETVAVSPTDANVKHLADALRVPAAGANPLGLAISTVNPGGDEYLLLSSSGNVTANALVVTGTATFPPDAIAPSAVQVPDVQVRRSSVLSIPSGGVIVSWTDEDWDTARMADLAGFPTRLVAPTVGQYLATLNLRFEDNATSIVVFAELRRNGLEVPGARIRYNTVSAGEACLTSRVNITVAGQYVEAFVSASVARNLATQSRFSLMRVSGPPVGAS